MANPLACAIAIESLRLLRAQDMEARVAHIERILAEELAPARDLESVHEVRVMGSIGVVELNEPVNVGEFQKKCVERGIWVRPFGRNAYIMPPYVIADDDLRTLAKEMIGIIAGMGQEKRTYNNRL